jgi:hypothetical protein
MEISKNEICRERSQLRMYLWLATMRFHVSSSARQHDVNTLVDRTRSQLFERRVPNRTCTDPSYTKGTRPYADRRGTHTDHPDDHMRAFSTSLPGPLSGRGSEYCWYLLFCLRTIASPAESFVPTKKHTKNDHETGAPQRYASPSRREREKLRRCGSRRPNPSVMKGASVSVALVTSAPPGKETDGDTSACQVFALLRKPNIEPLPTIIYNR